MGKADNRDELGFSFKTVKGIAAAIIVGGLVFLSVVIWAIVKIINHFFG